MRFIGLIVLAASLGCSEAGQTQRGGKPRTDDMDVVSKGKTAEAAGQRQQRERPFGRVNVSGASFSPDGKRLLVSYRLFMGRDHPNAAVLHLWDVGSGRLLRTLRGQSWGTYLLAFLPDGKHAVAAEEGGMVRVWDVEAGRVVRQFRAASGFMAAALSADGKFLLSQGYDGEAVPRLILHEIDTGKLVQRYDQHRRRLHSIAFSPDGKWALFGCTADLDEQGFDDKLTLQLWDVQLKRVLRSFSSQGPFDYGFPVAFSPNGRWVVSSKWTKHSHSLAVWEAQTGTEVLTLDGEFPDWVRTVAFTTDGKKILAGGRDGLVCHDAATGKVVRRVTERLRELTACAFSQDGSLGFSARGQVKAWRGWPPDQELWDTVKGQRLRRLTVNDKYSGGYLPK
jgi:WD40 repeat protein